VVFPCCVNCIIKASPEEQSQLTRNRRPPGQSRASGRLAQRTCGRRYVVFGSQR
jgi:hypothetical protein